MKCTKCDHVVSENARFCGQCGQPIGVRTCKNCGADIKTNAPFCEQCGAKQTVEVKQCTASNDTSKAPAFSEGSQKAIVAVDDYIYFIRNVYNKPSAVMRVHRSNPLDAVTIFSSVQYGDFPIIEIRYFDGNLYIISDPEIYSYNTVTQSLTDLSQSGIPLLNSEFENGIVYSLKGPGSIHSYDVTTQKRNTQELQVVVINSVFNENGNNEQELPSVLRIHDGYFYACPQGSMTTVRFPISDVGSYEYLPNLVGITENELGHLGCYFHRNWLLTIKYGSVTKSYGQTDELFLVLIDLDTLKIVREFDNPYCTTIDFVMNGSVIISGEDGNRYLLDFDKQKVTSVPKSCRILDGDRCFSNDYVYSFKRDNVLYRMKISDLFVPDNRFDSDDYKYYECPPDCG